MSRNPHDRAEQHFGDLLADLVELGDDIGPLPAGMTLQEALAYLWGRVEFYETGGFHRFATTADAYLAAAAITIAGSFTGNSIMRATQMASLSADALLAIALSFTADASLVSTTQVRSTQVPAEVVLSPTPGGRFTQTLVEVVVPVPPYFIGRAVLKKTMPGSFTANAEIVSPGQRFTQTPVEVVASPTPAARISQGPVEVIILE